MHRISSRSPSILPFRLLDFRRPRDKGPYAALYPLAQSAVHLPCHDLPLHLRSDIIGALLPPSSSYPFGRAPTSTPSSVRSTCAPCSNSTSRSPLPSPLPARLRIPSSFPPVSSSRTTAYTVRNMWRRSFVASDVSEFRPGARARAVRGVGHCQGKCCGRGICS